jgi:hypothetical protein
MPMQAGEPINSHVSLLEELADSTPDVSAEAVRRHVWSGKSDALKA